MKELTVKQLKEDTDDRKKEDGTKKLKSGRERHKNKDTL